MTLHDALVEHKIYIQHIFLSDTASYVRSLRGSFNSSPQESLDENPFLSPFRFSLRSLIMRSIAAVRAGVT